MQSVPSPLRLRLDGDALAANWRNLDRLSGTATAGAAVKANGYGLGAKKVATRLYDAGCRDFYVANWTEAQEIEAVLNASANVSVLNGVRQEDMDFARTSTAKPVLNTMEQARRWSSTGKPCDVMINSGMNRLGINPADLANKFFADLNIDIAMSHLASADENTPQNSEQLTEYRAALNHLKYKRTSLANSAGIALGPNYHFDCTRPGLALYGGKPVPKLDNEIRQVAFPEAQILQVRTLQSGDRLGYNATFTADREMTIAIIAIGYADGYLRGFSGSGLFMSDDMKLPVKGRISMDLVAIDISLAPALQEGDWVQCHYDLPAAASASGLSQYELLTGLGQRYARLWE